MLNRLNRLENEVDSLSRQVYRGGVPPASPGTAGPGIGGGNLAADFEVRLQRLEREIANLTGRAEEAQFGVTQVRQRLEKMEQDMELRLQELDERLAAAPAAPQGGAQASGAQAPAAPSRPQPGAANTPPAPAPRPGNQQAASPPPAQPQLPAGNAQEQYDRAFALLRGADYDRAEQALSQFIRSHPNHSLTPNAQYWLAETYYARNRYREAAVAYGEAYQKAPKGPKASDNLLKLGMSLGALNRKDDACLAFAQLNKEFPDAPATVKRRAEQERTRIGCR
jgi:tol-pal system protein YbgF